MAHAIATRAARRALEGAENQLRDTQRELADVAALLQDVRRHSGPAQRGRAERDRSTGKERSGGQTGAPASSKQGPGRERADAGRAIRG
eukprot:16241698-Heterocapsa_arctica.AAC.1